MKPINRKFFKMTLQEQEVYLIERLMAIHREEDRTRQMLAQVRGGYKYEATTEVDRPDLLELKTN